VQFLFECLGRWPVRDMQEQVKKRKRKRGLYFSSSRALASSRMARTKKMTERFKKRGITRVLEFEGSVEETCEDGDDETRTTQIERRPNASRRVVSESSDTNETQVCLF